MAEGPPAIVVTGISGNLGRRLLPMLSGFRVVGVDFRLPETNLPIQFTKMDLGLESSCLEFLQLLRDVRPVAVVHLAFVMDAVSEANREWPMVEKFIFMSSVSAYGPDLSRAAAETSPLAAHTYIYGVHKMEADRVVQQRSPALRGCSVYILRPHIFAGASVDNYFMEAFRGVPGGASKRAVRMRERGTRLPCMLPSGTQYLQNRIQFVHIDDVARLVTHVLKKTEPEAQRLTILNVAGRGEPLTYEQCVQVAKAKLVRVPTKRIFELVLRFLWNRKISTIPPDVAPDMTSDTVMDTTRLQEFLGTEYKNVIRYPIADAFGDCFKPETAAAKSS